MQGLKKWINKLENLKFQNSNLWGIFLNFGHFFILCHFWSILFWDFPSAIGTGLNSASENHVIPQKSPAPPPYPGDRLWPVLMWFVVKEAVTSLRMIESSLNWRQAPISLFGVLRVTPTDRPWNFTEEETCREHARIIPNETTNRPKITPTVTTSEFYIFTWRRLKGCRSCKYATFGCTFTYSWS